MTSRSSSGGRRRFLFAAGGLLGAPALLGCGAGEVERAASGETMGTAWRARWFAPRDAPAADIERARAAIEGELERVNASMSTWRETSEISLFNAEAATGAWFSISEDFAYVARAALEIAELTGGAFDPTVAPLVRLWGFARRERGRDAAPPAAAIAREAARVGWRKIALRASPPALRKEDDGVELDLSAIAKGHAVDRVGEALAALGAAGQLTEIGGEVRARGSKQGAPWILGIEAPDPEGRVIARRIALEDAAVASSGDYRAFFETGGRRYSHLIDPRTGAPIRHGLASASVIAPSCMRADALATALMVLGAEAALELAEREKIAAFLIERANGVDRTVASSAFAPYLV